MEIERQLWNESRTRDLRMVDFIHHPPTRQRVSEGVPTSGMPRRELAAALLACIEGYEIEDRIGDVPLERRSAALLRIANHETMPTTPDGRMKCAALRRRPCAWHTRRRLSQTQSCDRPRFLGDGAKPPRLVPGVVLRSAT